MSAVTVFSHGPTRSYPFLCLFLYSFFDKDRRYPARHHRRPHRPRRRHHRMTVDDVPSAGSKFQIGDWDFNGIFL